jgi:hypothetical protein
MKLHEITRGKTILFIKLMGMVVTNSLQHMYFELEEFFKSDISEGKLIEKTFMQLVRFYLFLIFFLKFKHTLYRLTHTAYIHTNTVSTLWFSRYIQLLNVMHLTCYIYLIIKQLFKSQLKRLRQCQYKWEWERVKFSIIIPQLQSLRIFHNLNCCTKMFTKEIY